MLYAICYKVLYATKCYVSQCLLYTCYTHFRGILYHSSSMNPDGLDEAVLDNQEVPMGYKWDADMLTALVLTAPCHEAHVLLLPGFVRTRGLCTREEVGM